jgi:hypothetical protein
MFLSQPKLRFQHLLFFVVQTKKIVHDKRKSFYHQQETNIVTNDKGSKDKNKTNTIVSPEFVLKHE